ncbi:MAG: hypothetical protein COZ80_01360 [Ignavibacteria bacterium CG_4_8_14_3_um_filter_37_9]|nr:protein kinase [Ignavibacteria bacterium]PIS43922.1 MAG: hypothetical protein COT22_13295 [Ignavibacteria bacterium CG08_land_8_20_14_0_20_37_9]PIX00213.1 MAG: hypothetical protein COZ80_01360 [Ignavibacteria bacterium CG_4_8_14_3_um_filter_37_9]PIX95091.1 MAG: hypothetical protein COZ25_02225 [Ignavibacteria bacterium CG_4_10_14_3_um_filter_37_18]PJC57077.1 MAG: hypothetical protein CO025_15200 [Ignavibacteria bacterium CG_4_9_14_0_2_um_filter_37_13]
MTQKIQSYELIERVGIGGMGEVWKARHIISNEIVAIKSIFSEFSNDAAFRHRFLQQTTTLEKLNHKNIVRITEFIEEPAALHLVMELIEGQTLDKLIGEEIGPIPFEKALPLFIQILEGISYAHKQRIVHRDLKPGKIFVTTENIIKITGYGVVRNEGRVKSSQTGTKKKTLFYKSPQQARGERVDEQCDIYSAGIILYEMLTGKLPFEMSGTMSDFTLMNKIIIEKLKDPRELNSDIPEGLANIIVNATKKEKSERIKSADVFISLLKTEKEGLEKKFPAAIEKVKHLSKANEDIAQNATEAFDEEKQQQLENFGVKANSIKELLKGRLRQKEIKATRKREPSIGEPSKGQWKGGSPKKKKIVVILSSFLWMALAAATFLILYSNKTEDTQWFKENLNVDHYRNGDSIPEVQDPDKWAKLKTGAWCYYDNDPENGKKFGKLYNWYAVNDPRGIAPAGWHLPALDDFAELAETVNGNGDAMKVLGHRSVDNTNESPAIFAGARDSIGYFFDLNYVPYYWSSTEHGTTAAYCMVLLYHDRTGTLPHHGKRYGFSVWCIKDN